MAGWRVWLAALFLFSLPAHAAEGDEDVYLSVDNFVAAQFSSVPDSKMMWLDQSARDAAEAISGEDPGFRRRYWREGERTAWVVDVIGRDHPITLGISVEAGHIQQVRVLVYRESRGWEVRQDFFTRQFEGVALEGKRLDARIDGITGATLSVNALQRAARLVLWLHERAMAQ